MAITIGSTTANSGGTLSASGIGSGLDVNSIVSQLMAVESKGLTALDTRASSIQTKISALGTVKAALAKLQGVLTPLAHATSLATLSAQSSDTGLTATVSGRAVAGNYTIDVTQLAQATKLASDGFTATTDVVGTGSLTFEFGTFASGAFTPNGTSGAKTVTIPAGSQTLAGVRDAVNAAGIGVTATIVNDGSAAGNHLVFTANATGAANSLRISASDDDGNGQDAAGLSRLAYDPAGSAGAGRNLTQKVTAQDAKLMIDGINITKPSNSISDAIEGVTLNLAAVTSGAKLTIAADTSGTVKKVQDFVAAYNALETTLRSLTKFDASTKQAAALTGDSAMRSIQSRLTAAISNSVAGLTAGGATLATLGQVGVSLQADGTLAVDATKLANAAHDDTAMANLFAAVGRATDAAIDVTQNGTATKAGTYAVNVTQLATHGTLAGAQAAGLTVTQGVNDRLDVTIDGIAASVTLAAGTYATADALAAEVQSRINGANAITSNGSRVAVAANAGALTITSARYGTGSKVAVSGNGAASLLGASPVSTTGLDVAGTIDGVVATGAGQSLRGAIGSAAEGLVLAIRGGATGARGSVTYSVGYAASLDRVLSDLLAKDGVVSTRTEGMNKAVADLGQRKTALARRLAIVEAHYRAQFTALDTTLGNLTTTSTYLTQQLANLPKIGE